MTVRFTAGPLGLVEHEQGTYFVPEVVSVGDVGEDVGLHPDPELAEAGWHLVRVRVGERELFCPCHERQFEEVSNE